MLKLSDDGAHITLNGQPSPTTGGGLFWFAGFLILGAVGVVIAMATLPVRWALLALAVFVVASFIFNYLRQQQVSRHKDSHIKDKKGNAISNGKLDVTHGQFTHHHSKGQNCIALEDNDRIQINDGDLLIVSNEGQQKCCVSGFDSEKEAQVMQAVLQGQKFGKRNANIKMRSS